MKEKAKEYGIKLDETVPLEITAHYLRHHQTPCPCVDCQSVLHLLATNTLLHPDSIFLGMEKAILELKHPEINEHIATFHQLTCPQAKKIVASTIIDLSISHCTNATEFILDNSSILVFQYCLDDSEIELQFQDQYVHFILKNKTTIHLFISILLPTHKQYLI